MSTSKTCKICHSQNLSVLYQGQIRVGKPGNYSQKPEKVLRCDKCLSNFLDLVLDPNFYTSEEYRLAVDGSSEPSDFYKSHDREQIRNLELTGTDLFRDKTVADIGCGAGSFLDFVRGTASQCVAIEPSRKFQEELKKKGYSTFSYTQDALKEFESRVDIVCSFSVIEHIADPLPFLKEAHRLLKTSGKLILSTPNTQDALLEFLPEDYRKFYYRKAHLWYFDETSIHNLLQRAGFQEVQVRHYQRFGLANFLNWSKNKTPAGDSKVNFVTDAMDRLWKSELERQKRSDYILARK